MSVFYVCQNCFIPASMIWSGKWECPFCYAHNESSRAFKKRKNFKVETGELLNFEVYLGILESELHTLRALDLRNLLGQLKHKFFESDKEAGVQYIWKMRDKNELEGYPPNSIRFKIRRKQVIQNHAFFSNEYVFILPR